MRYHYEKPPIYLSMYGQRYCCDHPVYNHCTLFLVGERGLAVIQQRYDPETKHTFWAEVDEWLTDPLYLHPRFRAFFDRRAGTGTDGLYPTVTIRQIMWALKMKPLPKRALGDGLRPYADLTTSFMRNQLILKGVAVYENIQEQAVRCGADALRECSDIPGAGRHGAGIYRDDCSSAVLCKRKLDLLKGTAQTRAFPFIFALISQLLLRRTMLVKGGKGAWTK
ncbi:MAG: hypothetical protein ACLRNQ_17125 [Flavonifractor plautii]